MCMFQWRSWKLRSPMSEIVMCEPPPTSNNRIKKIETKSLCYTLRKEILYNNYIPYIMNEKFIPTSIQIQNSSILVQTEWKSILKSCRSFQFNGYISTIKN